MSKHVKRSGLYAMPLLMAGATLVGIRFLPFEEVALAERGPTLDPGEIVTAVGMSIGPVVGLTTRWHVAPEETSIPLGTLARFSVAAPLAADVTWTGAQEVWRARTGSFAVCPLEEVGQAEVRVEVVMPGAEPRVYRSVLDVVDFPIDQIEVGPIEASVELVDLDENSTNEETMYYFFNFPSIAKLRELGEDQYRTSVERDVLLHVEVDPPGFAPLMEWRVDGAATRIGGSVAHSFRDIGVHAISAGPPGNSQEIEVETYKVTITSHQSNQDIVPEGEPVTFEAVTDPPGYEDEISWLSSTKYGTAVPVLGEGPTFTVQFDDTWGDDPVFGRFQWLGVRADDDMFNQDQKAEIDFSIDTLVLTEIGEDQFEITIGHGFIADGDAFPDEVETLIKIEITGPEGERPDDDQTITWQYPSDPHGDCFQNQGPPCDGDCPDWTIIIRKEGEDPVPRIVSPLCSNVAGVCRCVAAEVTINKEKEQDEDDGIYIVTVTVDPFELIKERDESNNSLTRMLDTR